MKALVFIALMVSVVANASSLVVQDAEGNSLKIYDTACTDATVLGFIAKKRVRAELVKDFKAGEMLYKGKEYKACWLAAPDGHVYVIDDAGDISKIPMEAFQRMSDV